MVRAVLFDLDDTLFDHSHCARAALRQVHAAHACFESTSFADLEMAHCQFLEELHGAVLAGRISLEDARRERFRRLFVVVGVTADQAAIECAAQTYRQGYVASRQAVAGAAALLQLVKTRARVGIVSNNLLEEQSAKLRHCGLESLVDTLVVSEEAGVSKPDPHIFRLALERLGCEASEAVMIGDSWNTDVRGARAAGVRAIWFNPSGTPAPEVDRTVVQLRSLEPAETVIQTIFEAASIGPPHPALA
jgi:HAD superfamily hydrolase (TIGR01549 family)